MTEKLAPYVRKKDAEPKGNEITRRLTITESNKLRMFIRSAREKLPQMDLARFAQEQITSYRNLIDLVEELLRTSETYHKLIFSRYIDGKMYLSVEEKGTFDEGKRFLIIGNSNTKLPKKKK